MTAFFVFELLVVNVVSFCIAATFENALSAGFIQATDYVEIWQVYLDYLRRRVDFRQGTVVWPPQTAECVCVGLSVRVCVRVSQR